MDSLKERMFSGISFDILGEEFIDDSNGLAVLLRMKNNNSKKREISLDINYVSVEVGVKRGFQAFAMFRGVGVGLFNLQSNAFIDLDVCFGPDVVEAEDGDRIELIVDNCKTAYILLLRENGKWLVLEEKEPVAVSRNLKKIIEQFEGIEEKCGLSLQNFSVKVEDEYHLKIFCEVLALNGEVPDKGFQITLVLYDKEDNIIYQDYVSKYDGEFKGFDVISFNSIRLDIPVEEIGKIRIYPTK